MGRRSLSLPEVAVVLGITRQRAWQIVVLEKKMTATKENGKWKVRATHLRMYLEDLARKTVEGGN